MDQREMASLGGKARAKKLTRQERKESAKKAVEARWAKTRKLVDEITVGTKELLKRSQASARRAKAKKPATPQIKERRATRTSR